MYKKIKNGSFMNLIWFIVCIIPMLIVFLATFGQGKEFSWGENVAVEHENVLFENATIPNGITLNSDNTLQYQSYYRYDITNIVPKENNTYIYEKLYIYVYSYYNYNQYDVQTPLKFRITDFFVYNPVNERINNETMYKYEIDVALVDSSNNLTIILGDESENSFAPKGKIGIYISNIDYDITSPLNNWQYYYTYTFEGGTLDNINNTIKTNGFISNSFLNLASLFGVNNVYMSLACYYIEYLLVVILLHLAFDVLYILPNVCHKFMEKIGGERD